MNKTTTLIIPVRLSAVALAILPAQAWAADHSWPRMYHAQVSFIVADGFSAGLGAGLSEHARLAVNLDIGRGTKSMGASMLLVYPEVLILTGLCGGVGLTASSPRLNRAPPDRRQFGAWFAEFEWPIPPRNYGKSVRLRSHSDSRGAVPAKPDAEGRPGARCIAALTPLLNVVLSSNRPAIAPLAQRLHPAMP